MTQIVGSYLLELSDDVDTYLASLGVGQVLRKVQSVAKPTIEVSYMADTDEWKFVTSSCFKTQVNKFKLGQEFDDETFDARRCKTTVRMEGNNKFIFEQKCEAGPPVVVTQEFKEPEAEGLKRLLLITMKAGDHQIAQHFRNVEVENPQQGHE